MKVLEVRHLSKVYAGEIVALKDINFEVQRGEFVAVIGSNGSGKSSLLRCINQISRQTSGEVILDGQNLKSSNREIAMIFQNFNLITRHSVLENTLMGALHETSTLKSLFGFFSREQVSRAAEYLRLVGLKDQMNRRVSQLSGGQQQRVAIARALMQKPEILLADEPVASLDPNTAHTVMKYLKFVNQEFGLTVICNLHFLSLVRDYATRVIALRDGEIIFSGAPTEINESVYRQIYGDEAKSLELR